MKWHCYWILTLFTLVAAITQSLGSLLDYAVELHQRGDIDSISRAFDLYRKISDDVLKSNSNDKANTKADGALALHNMGLIVHTEHPGSELSLQLVDDAAQLDPTIAHVFNTRGAFHKDVGNYQIAIESYRTAIELDPTAVHYHLGLAAVSHFDIGNDAAGRGDFTAQDKALSEACRHYSIALELGGKTMSVSTQVGILNDYSIALSKQGRQREVVEVLKKAVELDDRSLQSLGNYAIALRETGDLMGALRVGEVALKVAPDEVRMRFNYGLILQTLERLSEAAEQWKLCLEYDVTFYPALESLGHYEGSMGNPVEARKYYDLGLEAIGKITNGEGTANVMSINDAQSSIGALKLMSATACIPPIFKDNAAIESARTDLAHSLNNLLSGQMTIYDPMTSLGSGSLGYYLIYTGHNDVYMRRMLASVYWKFAPSLYYTAPFLQLSEVDRTISSHQINSEEGIRIRVGFVCSFFYRHSVGLLTQGVIEGLSRKSDQFHTVLIYPVPHADPNDDLFQRIKLVVHKTVEIPKSNLAVSRTLIANENLDVLIYAEIGMDHLNYFLSFSMLARRTVVFWGHAVTSGVSRLDSHSQSVYSGGCDYFISSDLFEGSSAPQRRYSERLYLMRGLTTSFHTPDEVRLTDVNLTSLGLPPLSPLYSEGEGMHLYLIPQTLYKLNPNFDQLIVGVLTSDPLAIIGMPAAQEKRWTKIATDRLRQNLGESLFKRVYIFRRLSFSEFSALAASSHVVLDPFPLGGGRSSFEILSAGTPIVVLASHTHILQLTSGMYETMGITAANGKQYENELLVTYCFKDYIEGAVKIATNSSLRSTLRNLIARNKHLLFHRQDVVEEWAEFLSFASRSPKPSSLPWWTLDDPLRAVELFGENIISRPNKEQLKHAVAIVVQRETMVEKGQSVLISVEDAIGGKAIGEEMEVIEGKHGDDIKGIRILDTISIRMTHYDLVSTGNIIINTNRTRSMSSDEASLGWYWRKKPWGWEASSEDRAGAVIWPNEKADDLIYALKLSHTNETSQESFTFLIEVFEGDDPSHIASLLAERIEAEPVKAQWLQCLLLAGVKQHAKQGSPPFAVIPLQLVDANSQEELTAKSPHGSTAQWGDDIKVHVGDDLKLVAAYMSYRYAFNDQGQETILNFLINALPEYSSSNWVETRQATCLGSTPNIETSHHTQDIDDRCAVVVGMTTCKRLDLFTITATSMLSMLGDAYTPSPEGTGLVCRVIVVDDGSDMQDIAQMKTQFPDFEYVLKPSYRRGHAESMNLLLEMIVGASAYQTPPFFLYVEDDWLFLEKSPQVIYDAYHLLSESRRNIISHEQISQVLFNSQGSRFCAYADPQCLPEDLHASGWLRIFDSSSGTSKEDKRVIEYMKHEFGTSEGHPFGYWPGFSLNPGLWDLRALLAPRVVSGQEQRLWFNTTDKRFEQSISLHLALAGHRTAHFPKLCVKHIGVETSAYELNGERRPWDKKEGD